MIRAVVVDDEWYNLEEIGDLLEDTGYFAVIKRYQNPIDLLEEMEETSPEVAFIDIEMPEIDGLTLAERLLERKPDLIITFITSWNQYAVQAFDLNAIDYIVKPINRMRFHKMADKVRNEVLLRRKHHPNELMITCFGRFEVRVDNEPVKWERSKTEELFAYLIMNHNVYVSKEIIIEHLWPEYEPKKALQLLQTSICKIRSLFSDFKEKIIVQYSQNKYCLTINHTLCDWFDVIEVLYSKNSPMEHSSVTLERIFKIIIKGFLSEQGYLWSMSKDEEITKELITIIENRFQVYQHKNMVQEIIISLKQLTKLVPYDEVYNYHLIKVYLDNNYELEARRQYQRYLKVLQEEYDTTPPETFKNIFN